jgi:hypothetical protein
MTVGDPDQLEIPSGWRFRPTGIVIEYIISVIKRRYTESVWFEKGRLARDPK